MSFFDIDFNDVKVEKSFEPVPVGTYNVISDDAELKETKDGQGAYILMKFKILDGDQDGRFLFANFNTMNKNEQAVKIGLQQLKGFIECAKIKQNKFKSPTELVGYKAQAVVKHKVDSYGTKAVISYFKAFEGSSSPTKDAAPKKAADGLW